MELGVDNDPSFRFTATYFGSANGGYFVDAVNGTAETAECDWFLYYRPPGTGAVPMRTTDGVSDFTVPDDGGTVILRYQTPPPPPSPTPTPEPPPVTTPTPTPTTPGPTPTDNGAVMGGASGLLLVVCALLAIL